MPEAQAMNEVLFFQLWH